MKIEKYKYTNNGKYKVTIDNKEYEIYEDTIIKYNILTKKNITENELKSYIENNNYYEAYYKCIKYIKTKLRSEKEIEEYLTKNNYEKEIIEFSINKLIKEGYLNNKIYAKAFIIDSINLKNVGPNKIKQDLKKLGIEQDIIDNEIKEYTKELEIEKIQKIVQKKVKTNKNKSSYILQNKIKQDLINLGYNLNLINENIKNITIDDKEIYQKEYNKLYNKLSKKYKGVELEYKIKEKLYQKGFSAK